MATPSVVDSIPGPIAVGPEMAVLERFCRDSTWDGWIRPGGMGPGTPRMRALGQARFHPLQEGRWLEGAFEQDQYLEDGTFVLHWELQWIAGWVPQHGEYRATVADNYGNVGFYRGHVDGDLLVFESMPDAPVRLRFTWDASDPEVMIWRNETALVDGSWFLIEEYAMHSTYPVAYEG